MLKKLFFLIFAAASAVRAEVGGDNLIFIKLFMKPLSQLR